MLRSSHSAGCGSAGGMGRCGLALVSFGVCGSLSAAASATTTLTVDLSSTIGPATHVANGSLYGVLETQPSDVMGLIAPLHPKMFNNPAADVQQPVGDAIVVAGRVASIGATVTIRLADWFTGFYTFTNMTDWFNKIGQTVSRRKAAGLTNIYAYEIWNEPNGTWAASNPLSFNEFWRQTYVQLRQLDPNIKIIGPSANYYDQNYISSLLSFCKTNSCLPDIVGWHELGSANIQGDVQAYRALEKQLGVGPLPISINEYSGNGRINDEGRPGASAPLIAQFERALVDTACISFWDVGHPGRLGSLLATNTQTNGGWFFYEWYGQMTGNMVSTTSSLNPGGLNLDGFANLDATKGTASVLFGGVNDGNVQIVVKGFKAAQSLGATVHAVVERTPWVDRTTVVAATNTLSAADLAVANDQVTVTVPNTNANDGYRLVLTAVGGSSSSSTSAASTSASGSSSAGSGSTTSSGAASTSGTSSTAGSSTTAGPSTASSSGQGPVGSSATLGSSVSAGSMGSAGTAGSTGIAGSGGSTPSVGASAGASSSGCGCSIPVSDRARGPAMVASLGGLLMLASRRKRRGSARAGRARSA